MKVKEVYDIVVIGGGLTGYTAGILMLKRGLSVAVLEGFPWEWWLDEPSGNAPFLNYSGAILYGIPGSQNITTLLLQLGVPLNNPGGEGQVSFKTLEPGFQVLMPKRWLNVFSRPGEIIKEFKRVFPDKAELMEEIYERARRFQQKAQSPLSLDSGRNDGTLSHPVFLYRWTAYLKTLFGGGTTTIKLIEDLCRDEVVTEYMRIFNFGLTRRRQKETSTGELYEYMDMTSKPSSLINGTGQRGIFLCLKDSFQKAGGQVYRVEKQPEIKTSRKEGIILDIDGKRQLLSQWAVLDAPENGIAGTLEKICPKRAKKADRPALHMTALIPWKLVPEGMGGHLVMKLESDMDPLILTLAPFEGETASLEVLSTVPDGFTGTEKDELGALQMRKVRKLLRFLPEEWTPVSVREGSFPAFYGYAGFMERLMYPGPVLQGPNFHREGRFILVGRGDYLGSSLNSALSDGRDLAFWFFSRFRGRKKIMA